MISASVILNEVLENVLIYSVSCALHVTLYKVGDHASWDNGEGTGVTTIK